MSRLLLLSVFLLTFTVSLIHSAPHRSYDWILRDRVRGAYLSSADIQVDLSQTRAVGLNTLLPKFAGLQATPSEANVEFLRRWGDRCRELGVHLMPVYNFRGGGTEGLLSERREVTIAGITMQRTPCPLDQEFWTTYVRNRAVFLAKHATALGLTGACIDPEMYGADHSMFGSCCYCEACMREFAAQVGQPLPGDLAAAQRASWLKQRGLEQAFEQHFVDRIKTYCQQIECEVHATNPDFLIGVLLLDYPIVFTRAMALGLGTPTHPVLCFSETTYSPGYTEYVLRQQQAFADLPAHVLFVAGLWQQQFPAENLAEQYYTCAANSAGYWIYTLESMLEDVSKVPGYQLREPHERYWEAMKTANAELDKLVASGGKYVSHLKIRPYEVPLPIMATHDLKPEALIASPDPAPHSMGPLTVPRMRYRNPLYLVGRRGEPVTVTITNRQLANYPPGTQWALLSPEGKALQEGKMKLHGSHELSFTPTADGVYTLLAHSAQNCHTLEVTSGQRNAFVASERLPFVVNHDFGRMYFHVPAGVATFSLFVKADGQAAGRGGKVTVYDPEGQAAAHLTGDFGVPTELPVAAPPGLQGRVWCLGVEDATNDLRVHFAPGLPPYLSSDPARVVTVKP